MKKIFISHSAHQELDKEILEEVEQRLKEEGFHVFCDRKRLSPGDCWRHELYAAIGSCHAAVILVTKEALQVEAYPWVFKECSMFTILKWTDKGFPVFPITMTGVTAEEVRSSLFEVLHLNEIQIGSHDDLDSIVTAIKARLGGCSDEDEPLYHHYDRIADQLRSIGDPQRLKKVIDHINSDLDNWDPSYIDVWYRLARILLTLNSKQVIDALTSILPELGRPRSNALIQYIAPFWLDLPAIADLDNQVQSEQRMIQTNLPTAASDPEHLRTAFGLNAVDPETAVLYASRAGYLKKMPYTVFTVPNDAGMDVDGRYVRHITEVMNIKMNRKGRSGQDLDNIMIALATEEPIFVVIPHGTSKETVTNLRRRFWPFIFIVLTGKDESAEWDLNKFRILEPRLEAGKEDLASELQYKAMFKASTIICGR